jgi:transcriptional accessory protein Tex/SPT6
MDAAIIARIAQETAIPEGSVAVTVSLFEKGATGPFIVHYRKEATGGLDEAKVRSIQERMAHYREVYDQRAALLKFMSEQGKLTDELKGKIEGCFTKSELDDLHHQFRPRRKTRAAEAIEKGLEPLAEYFWNQESDAWGVDEHINVFVDPSKGISTREQALQGVVDIIAEWIWANFDYRKALREMLLAEGFVVSTVVPAKVGQKTKYNMYYQRRESVTTIPSHRVLAIRRGCKEGILISSIEGDAAKSIEFLLNSVLKEKESVFAPIIEAAVRESYSRILRPLIETEVRTQLKERADREAIRVFQENLSNLLLSPPAGPIVVMGVDWGKGDECSVAVVNAAGMFLEGAKIRLAPSPKLAASPEVKAPEPAPLPVAQLTSAEPSVELLPETANVSEEPVTAGAVPEAESLTPPAAAAGEVVESAPVPESAVIRENPPAELLTQTGSETLAAGAPAAQPAPSVLEAIELAPAVPAETGNPPDSSAEIEDARKILRDLITKYSVRAISIGTGTGARELETVLHQIVSEENLGEILIAAVNDAGIAIYSSSRIAREEFPDWSASARCAMSLARRLQDPLSELVRIDPKLIGVGQYQHDVDQKELHRGLLQTVQYCVNKVGANVNTAGESLMRYVSGLNEKLARRIVAHRTAHGPFKSRPAIMAAVGMDETTYEQAAGFLRIPGGENALDHTAVHPESYPIVEKMAATLGIGIPDLIGNKESISSLKLEEFVTEKVGWPTLQDIREELLRPGRDPRKSFKVPKFRSDVKEMSDLKQGMTLEGTVTNVTNFGAFVDIGVRQDGLVHLSQMSNRFIHDPREAVKVGDVVQVKVISVEPETKRIGLSMKALLPSAQRRRKKQPRRAPKPAAPARAAEAVPTGEAAATDAAASPVPVEKPAHPERPRQVRPHEGPSRFRRRGPRKPERPGEPEEQTDSSPKVPEPSLQEKIAILQSKFRRIN